MSGYAKCPKCKKEVVLKYPIKTKLNPFSKINLIIKAAKNEFDDVKVVCPNCGYKGRYDEFEK
jgi:predicted nucleic-acid-binding Zn-ribbon protein